MTPPAERPAGGGWRSPERRGEGALLAVTLAWGLSFPLIKIALESAGPLAFMALRFPLALLLLWPLLGWRRPARSSVAAGLLLALLLGGSYVAQVVGLLYTTPTRSAFVTGLSVILVPLLAPAFTRRAPGRWPTAGALVAAVGLYVLTDPGGGGLNRGDAITLITAFSYAFYVIGVELASKRHPFEDLLVLQFAPLAVIFLPLAWMEGEPVHWSGSLFWALLMTGPILAVTVYLQNRFQKDTTATRAAVIFAGEPVFAALFSFFLTGEALSAAQWGGAGLILLGILAALR